MDKYKKQITEVQDKMDAETKRADKSEFETKKLLERLEAISVERDRLQSERFTRIRGLRTALNTDKNANHQNQ